MSIDHQPIQPGHQVNHYLIMAPLGAGGAATVYQALNTQTDELCAIKVLSASAISDENMQRRFLREIATMQRIDHPNLVRVQDAGIEADSLYCVMELVDSGTLKDFLTKPIPWPEAVECAIKLCDGLAELHDKGGIHRDLKPGNIFFSSDGEVKIGDFGLVLDLESSRLTTDGMTVGTVLYMSPEQITGEKHLTGAADLYSLGCVLFEMLTSRPPYIAEFPASILQDHLAGEPPQAAELIDCPQALSDLIVQLLGKSAQDRPGNAGEVAMTLKTILANPTGESATAETNSKNGDKTAEEEPAANSPNLTERMKANAGNSLNKWVLGAVLTLIAAAIVIAAMLQGN